MRLSYLNKHYPIVSSREIKPEDRPCIICSIPLIGFICREIPTDEFAVHDHCIEEWIKLFDMGIYAEIGKEEEGIEAPLDEEEKEPEMEVVERTKNKNMEIPDYNKASRLPSNSKITTNPNSYNDLGSVSEIIFTILDSLCQPYQKNIT